MNCFNHPNVSAIGICKNCNKGLCKECLTEVPNGIACTATCVDEVIQIDSMISRNKKSFNTTSEAHMRNAYIYGGIGVVFIIFGFQLDGLTGLFTIMGLIFIVGAGLNVNSAMKYKSGK